MNIDDSLPCRASFRISCIINIPLKDKKWLIGGTYNDNFICDLASDATNQKELLLEVIQLIESFKAGLKNLTTLDNLLKTAINQGEVDVRE